MLDNLNMLNSGIKTKANYKIKWGSNLKDQVQPHPNIFYKKMKQNKTYVSLRNYIQLHVQESNLKSSFNTLGILLFLNIRRLAVYSPDLIRTPTIVSKIQVYLSSYSAFFNKPHL
jgi:hypothetical protein